MKALLVDDERLARARLRTLLAAHPEIAVVAEADSVDAAEAAIDAHAPEVIFLDVAMPGGSGFDLLLRRRLDAHVIFVTAYDAHALRAFEVDAVDYLLKPVEPERLASSLARLRARAGSGAAPPPDRVSVTTAGGTVRMIAPAEIVLVRAEGDYTELRLRDGTTCTQKLPLARWEARLGAGFARVHRSTLVALGAVARVERTDGTTLRLFLHGDAEPITVSRAHAAELKALLRAATK